MKGGGTLRDHLEMARRMGEDPPQLKLADPPEAAALVIDYFAELCATRPYVETVPKPILHSEIRAWEDLRRLRLTHRELEMLRTLDRVWLRVTRAAATG